MEQPGPLSLPLRNINKRRRMRGGTACLVVGVAATGVSVAFFLQPGAVLLGIWALAVGLGLCGAGAYLLRKAATSRW